MCVEEIIKQDTGTASNSTNYEAYLANTMKSKETREHSNADTCATLNLKQNTDLQNLKYHYLQEDIQLRWECRHGKRKYVSEETLFYSVG